MSLGIDLTVASERPSAFDGAEPDKLLTLDLARPERAVQQATAFARAHPLHGVFGVDDHTALVAAMIAEALGLRGSPVEAVRAAGDKYRQRIALRHAGVPVPDFAVHHIAEPVDALLTAHSSQLTTRSVVLKPLHLSASRGVIRADDAAQFRAAHARVCAILKEAEGTTHGAPPRFLVESYVPGPEFALEGLVLDGRLHVLALFDKPDPLEGPYFPETIYVTPCRRPPDVRHALEQCVQSAVRGLGLTRGPVHAELRYNEAGPWLIELAARPIGGRCGQMFRLGPAGDTSLEQLHLAHALGLRDDVPALAPGAHGVMMIPIPKAGIFQGVRRVEAARRLPGITDIAVTLHRGARVRPLPEDARYLGFIFARGETPGEVEAALRSAFSALEISVVAEQTVNGKR